MKTFEVQTISGAVSVQADEFGIDPEGMLTLVRHAQPADKDAPVNYHASSQVYIAARGYWQSVRELKAQSAGG